MSKFSVHMPLDEIELEVSKALMSCFSNSDRQSYICLKMIDKILPPCLVKLMASLDKNLNKPESLNSCLEIAGVKCIIDFRIAFYKKIGKRSTLYEDAALTLHKKLTCEKVEAVNGILKSWTPANKQCFIVVKKSRKRYLDHYRQAKKQNLGARPTLF